MLLFTQHDALTRLEACPCGDAVFSQVARAVAEKPPTDVHGAGGAVEEFDPILVAFRVGQDLVDHHRWGEGVRIVAGLVLVAGPNVGAGSIGIGRMDGITGIDGG